MLASLHTHDASGVVHQEAVQPYPFTLGQFFDVWGVKFTPTQLGAYHAGKGLVLQTWVNGKQVPNGPDYKMKPHDVIVVGFGDPGSFPTKPNFRFPAASNRRAVDMRQRLPLRGRPKPRTLSTGSVPSRTPTRPDHRP